MFGQVDARRRAISGPAQATAIDGVLGVGMLIVGVPNALVLTGGGGASGSR
jgi:hypothetical protein